MPDLGDLPVLDVEYGHVPIVEGSLAFTLGCPSLKNHGMLFACQDVVELSLERVPGELRQAGEDS